MNRPNAVAAATSGAQPGAARAGDEQPADDRADPHRRGHEAEAGGADVQPWRAITGSETWNSYARQPTSAIISERRSPSSGVRRT